MLNPINYLTDEENLLWIYNANQEQRWNKGSIFPQVHRNEFEDLLVQSEIQQLFLARPNDTVLLQAEHDNSFISYLKEHIYIVMNGFPDVVNRKEEIDNPQSKIVIPFIYTDEIDSLSSSYGGCLGNNSPNTVRLLNNKFYVREMLLENGFDMTTGFLCRTTNELSDAYTNLKSQGFQKCVVKSPFGSSGKGLKVVTSDSSFYNLVSYLKRRSNIFQLIIEGWHETSSTINAQLVISEKFVKVFGITSQVINNDGVYVGTNFTPYFNKDTLKEYEKELLKLASILQNKKFTGVIGVDSIIDIHGKLIPVIEINARLTQVTYLMPYINYKTKYFKYINSRYLDLVLDYDISFSEINKIVQNKIDISRESEYLIYTFAKKKHKNKVCIRLYILFFSNDQDNMQRMLSNFVGMQIKGLRQD